MNILKKASLAIGTAIFLLITGLAVRHYYLYLPLNQYFTHEEERRVWLATSELSQGDISSALSVKEGNSYYIRNSDSGAYGMFQYLPGTYNAQASAIGYNPNDKSPSSQEMIHQKHFEACMQAFGNFPDCLSKHYSGKTVEHLKELGRWQRCRAYNPKYASPQEFVYDVLKMALSLKPTEFPEGQCTDFVTEFLRNFKGKELPWIKKLAPQRRHAKYFKALSIRYEVPRGNEPKVGAIWVDTSGKHGHVAITIEFDETTFTIIEKNNEGRREIGTRILPRTLFDSFIYI